MLPPRRKMGPASVVSVMRLLNARVAPTAPPKVVVALLLILSERATTDASEVSMVLSNVMLPALAPTPPPAPAAAVEVNVVFRPNLTASP